MKSRRRHKRARRKRSKVVLVAGLSAFVLVMFALSMVAFYSGRYEIFEKVSPPTPTDE
ncbi:MAG TPA: hypothetical protein VK550_16940 [Polyangiaceae bacterium]|nr:hypothetical protein [Polyangiaceae bacterium]